MAERGLRQRTRAVGARPLSPARKTQWVITIHGVNPNRRWQPVVQSVLEPHFNCIPYDYHDYDFPFGPIRVIANIPLFVGALFIILYALVQGISRPENWVIGGVGALFLCLSCLAGWWKRTGCAARLKAHIAPYCAFGHRPNVIAHSLGTYLIGHVLRKFPDIRLENVVLVSTVLPRSYAWNRILTANPNGARNVRSEFGRADYVIRAVGWIGWMVRDLGNAGLRGFYEIENWVHTTLGPTRPCSLCGNSPLRVPVHNVPLSYFGHSDHFLGPEHAQMLWLPFLWNIGIDEFDDYLNACLLISRLEDDDRLGEADRVIQKLWSRAYSWTFERTLTDFVRNEIILRLRRGRRFKDDLSVDVLLLEIKSILHRVTAKAVNEYQQATGINEWAAQGLHPAKAVGRAMNFFELSDE